MTLKLTRRNFVRAAALASAGVLAAACQPKIVNVEKVVTQVVKEEVIVEGTPKIVEKVVEKVVEVEKAGPEPVKVVFYHGWMEAIAGPIIEPMVREYEASHPGLFVSLIFGKVEGKVMGAVAAGTPPDICWSYFSQLAGANAIVPLEDYVTKTGFAIDQVYPYLVDGYTVKGELVGVPIENSVVSYWYHPAMFEEEGLAQPTSDWDWLQYRETAQKLTRTVDGRPDRYGTFWAMAKNYIFWTHLLQAGGSFLKEDLSGPAFNSEAGVRALSFLADIVLEDKAAPPPQAVRSPLALRAASTRPTLTGHGAGATGLVNWIYPLLP